MGTGDLFSSVRTFPQHPCDVSPLPCAQYRSLLLLLRSLFSVFPGVSSSTFRLSLSPSLSFFLSFRSTRLRCHSLRCTPFRPNNLADRRRTNVEPSSSQLCRIAEWETVRDIFLPGTVARYFPAVVYLLPPSLSFLLSSPLGSSRYAAVVFREKY